MKNAYIAALVMVCSAGVSAQDKVERRDYQLLGIPDPSIIEAHDGSGYYIVCSGPGIPIWHSPDLRRWIRVGRVFAEAVPSWARERIPNSRGVWAPDIRRVGDQYFVYYSVSTLGSQRSVIGLAVSPTLDTSDGDYHWEDRGLILESHPDEDTFNAIDPALLVDDAAGALLFWGSYWDGIKAGRVDRRTGKLITSPAEATAIARRQPRAAPAIEAAYAVQRQGAYYLFVSWDYCFADDPRQIGYKVMVGRATNPLGPYVDRRGKPLSEGGGELVVMGDQRWRGPGHNSVLLTPEQDWLVHHAVDAQRPRAGRLLQIRPLSWQDGWPRAGRPLGEPPRPTPLPPEARVAGRWDHIVADTDHYDIFLEGNGLISGAPGEATWELKADHLLLKWKSDRAPAGHWLDRVRLDDAGRTYAGANQRGTPVRGRKRDDACAP